MQWQPQLCMELHFFTNLEDDHARIISVKFHQNPIVGFLEEIILQIANRQTDDGRTTAHRISLSGL